MDTKKESVQSMVRLDFGELLVDYIRILRKMWIWVLILTLLGGSAFYLRARLTYHPFYTASSTFTVNVQQDVSGSSFQSYYNNTTAEQMANTFPHILTSGVLKRRVALDLGHSVSGSISASIEENTNLLTISVTDSNPQQAYDTLQSVIKNYPEISEVIVGKTDMELLDDKGVPKIPDNPKTFKRSTAKGAIGGFFLAAIWAAFLVITRKTIRKESDIRHHMNTRCLGSVPQIRIKRRSQTSQLRIVLTDPKISNQLQEHFRILRNKIEYQSREYNMKTFLITSALAGEGKSTVAVNLALSLAHDEKKVVLIDCDLRHPSDRQILSLEDGPGLSDILEGKKELSECLLTENDLGLSRRLQIRFLPGGSPKGDGSELLGTEKMKELVKYLEEWADYIILDSAPVGLLTDSAVLAQYADGAAFVVRKDFARVDLIMDSMEHLAESQIQIIGGILNGV